MRKTTEDLPKISVVIPVEPGGRVDPVLKSLKTLDYPAELVEVVLVEGRSPSRQRNEGLTRATGDIVYFLDNDSEVIPDLFRRVVRYYRDESVVAVGGPAVTHVRDGLFQRCIGGVLASPLATMGARAKFASIGQARRASEVELILCNLSFRRDIIRKAGGFNVLLYPNEENELLNRLGYIGYKFVYDPRAIVNRSRRNNIGLLFRQIFGYGRGRMEHLMVNPSFFEPVFLAPLFFVLYLALLPLIKARFFREPIRYYSMMAFGTGAWIAFKQQAPAALLLCPLIFLTVHLAYGLGLISGYLQLRNGLRDRSGPVPVTCHELKAFGVKTWPADVSR